MLEIGNGGMTADEYRTHMSLWSLLAAPLIAGNDLRDMTDETKSILMNHEVIAIDQDPDGKPVKRISPEDATTVITVRPLHGNAFAIGLFNRDDKPQEISVKWAGLGVGKPEKIRDLWKHEDMKAAVKDGYSATVPSHGVVLLRVSAK
jgi:alpha-galactosidase